MISLIVLGIVFVLIAVRQVGKFRLSIWQIMLLGAVAVLVTGQISPLNAARAVNTDVLLFLFGVFIIGQTMEESGYLNHLSHHLFQRARSVSSLVLIILFGMGLLSALLLNDTMAIIGTPVVLSLAGRTNQQPKVFLLSLAFAITIGSVMSPIGNPQNLLIALHGNIDNPFVTFFRYLMLPTLVNLLLAFLLLRLYYRQEFHGGIIELSVETIKDARLAGISRVSLFLLVILICIRILIVLVGWDIDFRLTYIALIAALPVIVFLPWRPAILRRLDWSTLVFFVAMFILMQSVWDSGYFQSAINGAGISLTSNVFILGVSVAVSQLLSNVPLVALFLPVLVQAGAGTVQMMALAAGSTIAGNLTILGAASNVIIVQNAEKRNGTTIDFLEFLKIGAPLTVINTLVYWLFLALL